MKIPVTPERKGQSAKDKLVRIMKEVTESSGDLQINHTPPEICEMMLDKVDLEKAKSVMVLFNVEFIYELMMREYKGDIYYFTQSLKECDFVKELCPDVIIKYIDKEENPLLFMETWPEKFDIIVSNPPYSKKLDLKFLDKAFDIAKEEVIFVHPATAFIDTKNKTSLFEQVNKKIEPHLSSLTFFNGNPIFKIALFVPCSITHISKNKKGAGFNFENKITGDSQICSSIFSLTVYGDKPEFWSILKKIGGTENLHDKGNVLGSRQEHKRILSDEESFFVEITHIRGNTSTQAGNDIRKGDFFTFLRKDIEVCSGRNPKYNIWWEFQSEDEAKNFISYGKTNFARFCLSISKFSQHLYNGELKTIPWLDFTQEWTDEKLYAHFEITEEEQAFIKEVIPPYYD